MGPYEDIRVSVAIPTRNRSQKIQPTLQSILMGSRCPDEIVVFDQSDDDSTHKQVEKMQLITKGDRIRYVSSEHHGVGANRNDALRAVNGDFIAFCDDDICVGKAWLESMLHEWVVVWGRAPVVITGRILPDPEFEPGAPVPGIRLNETRMVFRNKIPSVDILFGGHFGASRELFANLGPAPFDESLGPGAQFPGADDEDFGYRVLKAGFPIVYEPSIVATHHPGNQSWRHMRYTHAVGYGAFIAKHTLQGDIAIFWRLGYAFIVHLVKSVRAYLHAQELEGSARLLSSAGLIIGFLSWVIMISRKRMNFALSKRLYRKSDST